MFIALDLETTGVNPEKDKIIEFGATKFDLDGAKENLQFFINPGIDIPAISTHITGITDDDVKDAPSFEEKKQEIQDFIGDLPIVGHNIQFDTNFLKANGIPLTNDEYDTLQLSSILIPQSPSHSLETLSHILKITHDNKHRALDDAIASMNLFLKLCQEFQALPEKLIKRIHKICDKTEWPLKKVLLKLTKDESLKKHQIKNNENLESTDFEKSIGEKLSKYTKNALFEISPPYKNIAKEIALQEDKDSYLAISNKLFSKLCHELPDEIAKLDSPENFFSPKRLKKYENKESFEENQATSLIKFIIWSEETKTGLISELDLFPPEKEILPFINANPTQTNIDEETFYQKAIKKDKNSPAICTHQYIKELESAEKIVILDFDHFENHLHYQTTTYLNIDFFTQPLKHLQKDHPDNQTLQSLFSKSEILFGLIGIIFEKYNDQNPYKARLITTNLEIASAEWTKIKESITNIFEISKELIEISTSENSVHLQNWKDQLKSLLNIFNHPELHEHTIIFEQDYYGNTVIRKVPKNIQKEITEILDKCKSYQIIGETFDLLDNGQFVKNLYKLDPDLPIEKIQRDLPESQITIFKDMPENESAAQQPFLDFIDHITNEHSGRIVILFNSIKQLEINTMAIKKLLDEKGINVVSKLTGSIGKISMQFMKNPEKSILLLTPRTWETLFKRECGKEIETLIIQKIPFEAPSNPFLTALSENFENPFFELQIPRATIALLKAINHLQGPNPKKIFIMDSRLVNKQYGRFIKENLDSLSKIKVTQLP